jgi:aminoglycoside 2'-N-acetyltransferase I
MSTCSTAITIWNVEIHSAPSDALSSSILDGIRSMLDAAFDGDFSDDDWNHAKGGTYVWLAGPHGVISHASIVERPLVCSGHSLNAGYVEAVATVATLRHQGYGTVVMTHINDLIRQRYALGALSTGSHAFYSALGWERWRGATLVETLHGRERTPDDDGSVMILRTSRTPRLNLDEEIVCASRPGDVW